MEMLLFLMIYAFINAEMATITHILSLAIATEHGSLFLHEKGGEIGIQ